MATAGMAAAMECTADSGQHFRCPALHCCFEQPRARDTCHLREEQLHERRCVRNTEGCACNSADIASAHRWPIGKLRMGYAITLEELVERYGTRGSRRDRQRAPALEQRS